MVDADNYWDYLADFESRRAEIYLANLDKHRAEERVQALTIVPKKPKNAEYELKVRMAMYQRGLSDRQIGEIQQLSAWSIAKWRRENKLKPNFGHGHR